MWKLALNEVRPHFFYISHFPNQYLTILTRNPSLKHTTLQRRCRSRSNHLPHDWRTAANNKTKQRTSSWYFSLFPSPLPPLRIALSHKHPNRQMAWHHSPGSRPTRQNPRNSWDGRNRLGGSFPSFHEQKSRFSKRDISRRFCPQNSI